MELYSMPQLDKTSPVYSDTQYEGGGDNIASQRTSTNDVKKYAAVPSDALPLLTSSAWNAVIHRPAEDDSEPDDLPSTVDMDAIKGSPATPLAAPKTPPSRGPTPYVPGKVDRSKREGKEDGAGPEASDSEDSDGTEEDSDSQSQDSDDGDSGDSETGNGSASDSEGSESGSCSWSDSDSESGSSSCSSHSGRSSRSSHTHQTFSIRETNFEQGGLKLKIAALKVCKKAPAKEAESKKSVAAAKVCKDKLKVEKSPSQVQPQASKTGAKVGAGSSKKPRAGRKVQTVTGRNLCSMPALYSCTTGATGISGSSSRGRTHTPHSNSDSEDETESDEDEEVAEISQIAQELGHIGQDNMAISEHLQEINQEDLAAILPDVVTTDHHGDEAGPPFDGFEDVSSESGKVAAGSAQRGAESSSDMELPEQVVSEAIKRIHIDSEDVAGQGHSSTEADSCEEEGVVGEGGTTTGAGYSSSLLQQFVEKTEILSSQATCSQEKTKREEPRRRKRGRPPKLNRKVEEPPESLNQVEVSGSANKCMPELEAYMRLDCSVSNVSPDSGIQSVAGSPVHQACSPASHSHKAASPVSSPHSVREATPPPPTLFPGEQRQGPIKRGPGRPPRISKPERRRGPGRPKGSGKKMKPGKPVVAVRPDPVSGTDSCDEIPPTPSPVPVAPVKRGPGRPKKAPPVLEPNLPITFPEPKSKSPLRKKAIKASDEVALTDSRLPKSEVHCDVGVAKQNKSSAMLSEICERVSKRLDLPSSVPTKSPKVKANAGEQKRPEGEERRRKGRRRRDREEGHEAEPPTPKQRPPGSPAAVVRKPVAVVRALPRVLGLPPGISHHRHKKRKKKAKPARPEKNIVDPAFLLDLERLAQDFGRCCTIAKGTLPVAKPGEVSLPSIFRVKRIVKKRKGSEKSRASDRESGTEGDGGKEKSRQRRPKKSAVEVPKGHERPEANNEQRLPLKKRHYHMSTAAILQPTNCSPENPRPDSTGDSSRKSTNSERTASLDREKQGEKVSGSNAPGFGSKSQSKPSDKVVVITKDKPSEKGTCVSNTANKNSSVVEVKSKAISDLPRNSIDEAIEACITRYTTTSPPLEKIPTATRSVIVTPKKRHRLENAAAMCGNGRTPCVNVCKGKDVVLDSSSVNNNNNNSKSAPGLSTVPLPGKRAGSRSASVNSTTPPAVNGSNIAVILPTVTSPETKPASGVLELFSKTVESEMSSLSSSVVAKPTSPSSTKVTSPSSKVSSVANKAGLPSSKTASPTTKLTLPTSKTVLPACKVTFPVNKVTSSVSKITLVSPSKVSQSPASKVPVSPISKVTSSTAKVISHASVKVTSLPASKVSSPVSKVASPVTKVTSPVGKITSPASKLASLPTSKAPSPPVNKATSSPASKSSLSPLSKATSSPISKAISLASTKATVSPANKTTSPVSKATSSPVSKTTSLPVSKATASPSSKTTSPMSKTIPTMNKLPLSTSKVTVLNKRTLSTSKVVSSARKLIHVPNKVTSSTKVTTPVTKTSATIGKLSAPKPLCVSSKINATMLRSIEENIPVFHNLRVKRVNGTSEKEESGLKRNMNSKKKKLIRDVRVHVTKLSPLDLLKKAVGAVKERARRRKSINRTGFPVKKRKKKRPPTTEQSADLTSPTENVVTSTCVQIVNESVLSNPLVPVINLDLKQIPGSETVKTSGDVVEATSNVELKQQQSRRDHSAPVPETSSKCKARGAKTELVEVTQCSESKPKEYVKRERVSLTSDRGRRGDRVDRDEDTDTESEPLGSCKRYRGDRDRTDEELSVCAGEDASAIHSSDSRIRGKRKRDSSHDEFGSGHMHFSQLPSKRLRKCRERDDDTDRDDISDMILPYDLPYDLPSGDESTKSCQRKKQPRWRKRFLAAGLFSDYYKEDEPRRSHGDAKSRLLYRPEEHQHGLLPPPYHCGKYLRQRRVEFKLPYDLWWLHTHSQLPGRDRVPSWNYKKIRTNVYYDVKPTLTYEAQACNCTCPISVSASGLVRKGCGEDCINRMVYAECSPQLCPCRDLCSNQRIQRHEWAPGLDKFMTKDKGWGVKTKYAIKCGEFILEYVGEVVSEKEFKDRMASRYIHDTHHYCLNLDGGLVIDGHRMGGDGRFVNHSCEPNCEMQKWSVNGLFRMALFALRDIQPHEELSYDYNFSLFNPAEGQPCKCGSLHCRGVIGGKSQRVNGSIMRVEEKGERRLVGRPRKNARKNSSSSNKLKFKKRIGESSSTQKLCYMTPVKPMSHQQRCFAQLHHCFLLRNLEKVKRLRERLKQASRREQPLACSYPRPQVKQSDVFLTQLNALSTPRNIRTRRLAQAEDNPELTRTARLAYVFRDLYNIVIAAKDERDEMLGAPFLTLPSKRKLPQYFQRISEPIDLCTLEQNIVTGFYRTVESFDQDMGRLFANNVRFFGRTSEMGITAARLRKVYNVAKMDFLSQLEEILGESPPSSFIPEHDPGGEEEDVIRCICGLYKDEGMMIQCERCLVWQHCDCVRADEGVEHYLCEQCSPRPVELEIVMAPQPHYATPGLTYFITLLRGTLQLRQGDTVYVLRDMIEESAPKTSPPTKHTYKTIKDIKYSDFDIFRIERLWKDEKEERFAFGHHYLRPHETYHEPSRKFFPNEVMRVPLYEVVPLDLIMGHCWVLDLNTFCKGRPVGAPEEHVYICEYRVDKSAHLFTKIAKPRHSVCTKTYAFESFDRRLKPQRTYTPHGPVAPRARGRSAGSRAADEEAKTQPTPLPDDDEELPLARVRDDALARKRASQKQRLNLILLRLLARLPSKQPLDLSFLLEPGRRHRKKPSILNP